MLKWHRLDEKYLISEEFNTYPYYFIRLANCNAVECFKHDDEGYVKVRYNGRFVRFHRLIYKHFFGDIPKGLVIDHIDHVRDNNRIVNLRATTKRENDQNRKGSKWIDLNKDDLIPLNCYKGHDLLNYYIGHYMVFKSNTQKYKMLKDNKLTDVNGNKIRMSREDVMEKMTLKKVWMIWTQLMTK